MHEIFGCRPDAAPASYWFFYGKFAMRRFDLIARNAYAAAMNLTAPTPSSVLLPTSSDPSALVPPARWARWWTSPIARFEYGSGSSLPLWRDAVLPAERGLTGALQPVVSYGGTSTSEAIAAAHLLAQHPVTVDFSYRNGRLGSTQVTPAIAVLRDVTAGVFWLAPLHTTVRRGDEWLDAPHTIDGPAFEGDRPLLTRPRVLSATSLLVAVVGANSVIRPEKWSDAPNDSKRVRR